MDTADRLLLIAPPLMKHTAAFDRAQALARAQDLPLHILAFDYVDGLATAGMINQQALKQVRTEYLASHRHWLEEQADTMRHHLGIEVTTEVLWVMNPLDEIMTHIQEMKPCLVIKDLEHESWLSRFLFTSLDVRLLRDCAVPLHLVGKVQHGLPRKVVAAVDPFRPEEQYDGLNERIIVTAEKFAAQCNAELHLLYAYDLSYIFSVDSNLSSNSEAFQKILACEKETFTRLADRFGVPKERMHLLMGNPARVIENFCRDEQIDVVVMGTVHRGRLNRWLGSTTEQVANHLWGSLLAVNPHHPGD